MNWGFDTSALLRIITKEPPELALRVAARIESILEAGETVSVSDLAVFEAYYALQHSYRMTKANAIADLLALSRQPGFVFSETAIAALSEPNAATMSPGLVDRMIAGEYRARGLRVLSCEKDFRKLPDAEVVTDDPFLSEANQRTIKESIESLERGEGERHDLVNP